MQRQLALELIRSEQKRRKEVRLQQQRTLERLQEIRETCKTLHGFIRESWHVLEPGTEFKDNWHLGALAEHLEAVHNKQITRLQINQPPGTMKSLISSVMFEAWEWGPGARPNMRYLTTSYQEGYARRDSRKHRDLVQSEWYQMLWPDVKLTRDNEMDFENNFRGGRRAVAFASLTAGRGNRLIIDDPHSTEQVESVSEIQRASRIFRESATSRLNDPETDAIIVIMHRLHPEDVCGIIDQLGLPYVKLVLPMEYVRSTTVQTPWFTDPRKEDGELLFPSRLSRERLEQNKIELGPHAYDTQYQQMPRAREGSYFFSVENLLIKEGEKLYPKPMPKSCDAVYAVIDTATKIGRGRDGTGVTYWAYTKHPEPSLCVIDWDVQQIEASLLEVWLPTVLKRCEQLATMCAARMGTLGAWIEDKDSGQILLQQALRRGLNVHAIESKLTSAGKEGRAISVSGYVYRGLVKVCAPAYEKTMVYKGRSKNHLVDQLTTFRMGIGTPADEDELFDTFCYGVAITLGNDEGY